MERIKGSEDQAKKRSFSISKILAPIDGSENSERALNAALRLTKDYEAEMVILSVIPMPGYLVESPTSIGAPPISLKEYYDLGTRDAKRWTDEAVTLAQSEKVKVRSEIIEATNSVVGTILSIASNEKADMIVIGTRGLGGFKKLLLGSVSNGVVTHAHCNVLVVR